MTYFAVNIYSGAENKVIEHITEACKRKSFDLITGIIAPLTKIKKFKGEKTCSYRVKSILPYIYVKINSENITFPAELYHFMKEIPGVIKILQYSIPTEEVEEFCNTVGSSIEEAAFEIDIAYDQKEENRKEEELLKALNDNQATKEEKVEAQKNLETVIKHPVEEALELVKEGTESNISIFQKIKIRQSKNKTNFKFPLAVLAKTIARIDPNRRIPNETITDPNFLLPHINKTLHLELNQWKNM